jgi:hypothetical protein
MDAHRAVRGLRESFYHRLGQALCCDELTDGTRARLLEMGGYRSTVFEIFPFFFLDLFPSVTADQALQLAYAGMLYMDYLRLEDAVTDGQPLGGRFVHAAIGGLVHEEALAILRSLLVGYDAFWPWLARYHQEYVRAVIRERDVQARRPLTYSREERDAIAAGKCASGKAALVALALLAGEAEPPAELVRSYDAFCVSYQLYDDLLDWRQDYASGLYSYLVVQALDQWQCQHDGKAEGQPAADELGRVIHYGGLAEDELGEAQAYAEQVITLVQGLGCPAWIATLRECQNLYARLSGDLVQLRERGLTRQARR